MGSTLKEGEIYNSNGPMLEAFLNEVGILNTTHYRATDDKDELQKVMDEALQKHDFLLLSGGISVGDYDFVKQCLEKAGVKELFYKIKQRPGKPLFAGKKDNKWIFALPGNPASVLSCFNLYVKPCLKFRLGFDNVWSPGQILPLREDQLKKQGFTFFLKGRIDGGEIKILDGQQSFNLQAFNTANCLVELEEQNEIVEMGTPVKVYNL
ncbi:molybdopterin-binding protein [Antarcticibacterium sp. 1MA-6-2]|nr:molybdopterin-binding protein [Antarcticibacterium sp. 1MA-6-2]